MSDHPIVDDSLVVPEEHRDWLRQADDLVSSDKESEDDLVPGVLGKGDLHLVIAAAKKAKTWLVLTFVIACAAGIEALGLPTPKRRLAVLLIEAEHRRGEFQNRLRRIARGLGVPLATLRVFVAHGSSFHLDDPAWIAKVQSAIVLCSIDLLVIDPLARAHSGNENDTREMQGVLRGVETLQQFSLPHRLGEPGTSPNERIEDRTVRTAIILIHHAGKGNRSDAYAARGNSSFPAAANTIWTVDSIHDEEQGNLKSATVSFIGKQPIAAISVKVEESADLFRLVPVDPDDQPGTTKETRRIDVGAEVLACIDKNGPLTRQEICQAIPRRKQTVLDAIAKGLASGLLAVIRTNGEERIGRRRVIGA